MAVYFRCKDCEQEHRSAVGFASKESFENADLSETWLQCPVTGRSASYDKKEMVWRDDDEQ